MNIFLSADFLMTSEKEQISNLKWLAGMLERPLIQHDVVSFILADNSDFKERFSREEFFDKSNLTLESNEVQFFFDFEQLTRESLSYIESFLNCDLVIGYELSEQTRKVLDYIGMKYIDIWLYPIRYLDDVLFGFKSNDSEIQERLSLFRVDQELFYIYADMLKVQNYRGFRRYKNQLIPNSALFVGQTLKDKAIFSNGSMLTLLDFKSKFKEYAQRYNRIYYSRHPFIKEGDEDIMRYLSRFSNVEITTSPTYNLLASDEIDFVFSVSSSVVHEAHFFGKKTEFLYKPIFDTYNEAATLNHTVQYYPIKHAFLFTQFWETIINGGNMQKRQDDFYVKKDFLRDTLSFYWGYRDIDKVESLKQTVSHLYKKIES